MRKREKKEKQCLYCGKDIPNRNRYCNNKCQGNYQIRERHKLISENKFTGNNQSIDRSTKRYLISLYGEKCVKCDWSEINPWTKKVPIELNHIDGDPGNHNIENCELICPNCHSLTEFHKRRGKGRKWRKTIFLE